ncbi:uncharacterized protein [Rhodnius prolixus]|uniref:uncharacterized protein n=1 Tax=Rhodnius prolixus TaxID=13249 RepID=UPI003D18A409
MNLPRLLLLIIVVFVYSEFGVRAENAAALVNLRLRRSPYFVPNFPDIPNGHMDYTHTSGTSYSKTYNNNDVGIFIQRADGSVKDQDYHDKNSSFVETTQAKKVGNIQSAGPNGKTMHYDNQLSDQGVQKESSKTGHKNIIDQPILKTGPNGERIVAKAKASLQQNFNHSVGESSRNVIKKKVGNVVERKDGEVVSKQNYDQTFMDNKLKDFKLAKGQKMVQDEGGNFSNDTYNQLTGKETGSHKELLLGRKDDKEFNRQKMIPAVGGNLSNIPYKLVLGNDSGKEKQIILRNKGDSSG